jgi:hypothetical protein
LDAEEDVLDGMLVPVDVVDVICSDYRDIQTPPHFDELRIDLIELR